MKYINTVAKKLSGSAFKKIRLEKEERESEILKKTQTFYNFFLILSDFFCDIISYDRNITSTPTTISNISIDTTSLQEREQNVDFNETKIEEQNNTVSQVTNTKARYYNNDCNTGPKCTELFKDVVNNSYLNSILLDPYLWKLNDRSIDIILSQNVRILTILIFQKLLVHVVK